MAIRLSRKQRLLATILISFSFFVAELIGMLPAMIPSTSRPDVNAKPDFTPTLLL
jgi:hypothetical protein